MIPLAYNHRALRMTLALLAAGLTAGCSSDQRASQMTSFSGKETKSEQASLFTIPQEQMSHVQVVTVEPTTLTRTLRLTGAVAYNAFNTTPVITQVGGPVTRILVVPGERVKKDQPLLTVTSPDYSLLFASYLKAKDTYRVADKNYDRAKDLYAHSAIAERDLLQAESDRNQAQADLNAALLGLKILGIPKPEDLVNAPSSSEIPLLSPIGGEIVERDISPRPTADRRYHAGLRHFRHEHRLGACECLPERSRLRESRRRRSHSDRFLPWHHFSRENFVRVASSRSHHANAAGTHRGR